MTMNRRQFITQGTLSAVAWGGMLHIARAAETGTVTVETAFGRIRGVDEQGIKDRKSVV